MASVQFREVTKTYGAFEAIKLFDLDIEDGEFCVLVGPSPWG
jgi:multiple sugar transport system ATP-binding protein